MRLLLRQLKGASSGEGRLVNDVMVLMVVIYIVGDGRKMLLPCSNVPLWASG